MNAILLDNYSLHSLTAAQPCQTKSATGLGFPEVRLDQYNRPGAHGMTIAHNLYGGRTITLEGTIRGADRTAYMANRAALEAAVSLRLDSVNVPIPRVCYLTDLDFNTYQISVVTKAFSCELTTPTMGRWQLQLAATDYIIESQTLSSVTTFLPQSGGIVYPVTYPVQYGGSSGGSVTASNNGNAPAFALVTLYGPMINPVIANDSTGEFVRLNLTLVAGDSLVISMKNRTIIQGGATNKMGAFISGSKFWAILPGLNNLRVGADAYDVGYATASWRSSFLGL
jgi:hypothetical protein